MHSDAEESAEASGAPPEQAFIPSESAQAGDAEVHLELRPTEDGHLALLCYESLELLLAACGNQQAWVSVYHNQVESVREQTGADVVLWNAALPQEVRKPDEQETP